MNGSHACPPCSPGTYMPLTASTSCWTCPANSSSIEGSARLVDCLCNPGWTGANGSECSACAPGLFKPHSGPMLCDICDRGTFSLGAQSICSLCPANTYINSVGATACVDCPASTYSGLGSSNQSLYCTYDILMIEAGYLITSNLSSFLGKAEAYREAISHIAGAHLSSTSIVSWTWRSDTADRGGERRLLLSWAKAGNDNATNATNATNYTEIRAQFTVPRYWKDAARLRLFAYDGARWVSERGLSSATLINSSYYEYCGAGRQLDPQYPSLLAAWNAQHGGINYAFSANGTNFTPPTACMMCPAGRVPWLACDATIISMHLSLTIISIHLSVGVL
jgi:hypothetical protein